jgi:UDP-N-acetylmuramoyl-tripeptide--D-alanyl-D-alanine ligase
MPENTSIEKLYSLFLQHPVICTDTRKLSPGCLFFALKGENFNGNKFALQAIQSGAAYAIVDEEAGDDERLLYVNDVLTALQKIATHHRRQFSIPVIAIAGSNGKTTTKELMAAVLKTQFKTLYTQGNLNNHIGVPLTLLSLNKTHEWAVIEIGANHQGENALLCDITEPDSGLVTNVGKDHLEGFGGIDGVKKASKEIYDYLKANKKTVVIQSGNSELMDLMGRYEKVIAYGNASDSIASGTASVNNGFLVVHLEKPFVAIIQTQLAGTYNLENVLAAVAVGNSAGVNSENIIHGIENYQPGNQRSQVMKIDQLTVLLDAYNANPSSMEAALKNYDDAYPSPRRIALGEMLELGEAEAEEHMLIAELAANNKADEVLLVGKLFKAAADKFGAHYFNTSEEAAIWLKTQIPLKGSILVKGSRGTKMERLLEAFQA